MLYCKKIDVLDYFEKELLENRYLLIKDEISKNVFNGIEFNGRDVAKYSVQFSGYKYEDLTSSDGDIMMPGDD